MVATSANETAAKLIISFFFNKNLGVKYFVRTKIWTSKKNSFSHFHHFCF